MQWFSTNIYSSCILNYPFLSELKLYTAETYLHRINFIILTRVWLKIYMFRSFCGWSKLARIFHRTDRTETLPPYPILICTTSGISAENFMLLSTNARFLQFQQLMECTIAPPEKRTQIDVPTARNKKSNALTPCLVCYSTLLQAPYNKSDSLVKSGKVLIR